MYQTRTEAGLTTNYATFREAYQAYLEDSTIWKISFEYRGEHQRWRNKTWDPQDCWSEHSERKLCALHPEYQNSDKLFWVHQKVLVDPIPEWDHLTPQEREIQENLAAI